MVSMLQHLMLSYYKRINCQLSFGGLFKEISNEMVEQNLMFGIKDIIWKLIEVICSIVGIDFIVLQEPQMKDDKAVAIFMKMLSERVLDESA